MKLFAVQLVAVLLFLLPVLTFWAARVTKQTATWEIALDIPLAVAASLLSVFVLARFMTVESAALVSRPVWAVALGVVLYRRRRTRPAWPAAIGWLELASVLAAVGAAVLICWPI